MENKLFFSQKDKNKQCGKECVGLKKRGAIGSKGEIQSKDFTLKWNFGNWELGTSSFSSRPQNKTRNAILGEVRQKGYLDIKEEDSFNFYETNVVYNNLETKCKTGNY